MKHNSSGGRITRLGLLVAIFSAFALASLSPSPSHATSSPSWWSGDCDVNNHSGSHSLGTSYNDVKSCGPGPTQGGNDYLVNFFPGAWGEYEWECVELSMGYMYLAYGIAPYSAPGGKDVVNNYGGSILTKVTNNGASVPSPGDILSFAASANHPQYGHTAVVTAVNVDGNGNGTVSDLDRPLEPEFESFGSWV